MAKYLDITGLTYLWGKITDYVDNHAGGGSLIKLENSVTTTAASTSTIAIGISGFDSTSDILLVDIEGLLLKLTTDYTISGTNIVLTTPITHTGTVVHFTVIRSS